MLPGLPEPPPTRELGNPPGCDTFQRSTWPVDLAGITVVTPPLAGRVELTGVVATNYILHIITGWMAERWRSALDVT